VSNMFVNFFLPIRDSFFLSDLDGSLDSGGHRLDLTKHNVVQHFPLESASFVAPQRTRASFRVTVAADRLPVEVIALNSGVGVGNPVRAAADGAAISKSFGLGQF
jgi:hypothetical protein